MACSDVFPFFLADPSRCYAAEDPPDAPAPLSFTADETLNRAQASKVLIVDDQQLIADTLAEILMNAGFDAVPAYDGWDALDKASRFHPNWVITDVLMPRMNGVELAIAMRQKYPQSTILLFSGQAGISDILQDGQRQGYQFELIAKPVHPARLIERLKQD
jgi:CheY-like chemotaxis protein